MKHNHHIIPKHMGGSDDPSNLIELTVEEHSLAHYKLYEQYGKKDDLCAYFMLSGKNQDAEFVKLRAQIGGEASQKKRLKDGLTGVELFYGRSVSYDEMLENNRKGGKIQGPKNAEFGHMKNIQPLGASLGGKKGSEICREKQVNAFFDPKLRYEIAKKGGLVQGRRNVESGHLKKIAQLSKGKIWITDGVYNRRIDKGDYIEDGWQKGLTKRKKV
jgi:hypothetical protein